MKLKKDTRKYENKILKTPCLEVYNEIYSARQIRSETAQVLIRLVNRAKKAYETEQAGETIGHEIGPDSKKICRDVNPSVTNEYARVPIPSSQVGTSQMNVENDEDSGCELDPEVTPISGKRRKKRTCPYSPSQR